MRVIDRCGRIRINNLEADASLMLKVPPNGSWRVNNNQQFQLYDVTTESWYTLMVTGVMGAETLTIGPADVSTTYACGYMESTPANGSWRVLNNNFQIYNSTTNLWYTLFVSGPAGAETLTIGPGEA